MKMTTVNDAERAGFEDWFEREAVARAICEACEESPDHQGYAQGNEYRWQDYLPVADAAISAWQRTQAAVVPEAKVTGAWESARIGDFNAGWNACRDSVVTLMKKAAYMELDTTKRSIAIQDELRALLAAAPATPAAHGAVPDVSAMAKVLSDRVASACCVDPDDNWKIYGQEYIEDVRAMLAAATAHPAERQEQEALHVWRAATRFGETCHFGEASTARAWAGENGTVERVDLTPVPELRAVERQEQGEVQGRWIPVSERLPSVAQEVIVNSEFDGVTAGFLDSYGEWYSPNSDYKLTRVVAWQPLPATPALAASTGQEVGK